MAQDIVILSAIAPVRSMPPSKVVAIPPVTRPGMMARVLRHVLLALTALACLLLVIAEFGDLNEIKILTVTKEGIGAGANHGYALGVIAVVGAVMGFGAWRGSRPAAFAVAVLGVAALLIVLLVDLPDVDATGLYGRNYEQAESTPALGFYLETAGAVLLLFAGVLTAVLGGRTPEPEPRRERRPVTDAG